MGKGYTRFSAAMRQTECGDNDGISHKPSKKLKKLSSVCEINQSTSSKRVKLPKKFFDDCYTVNNASVPRKLRSAIKQGQNDSVSPSLPGPRNRVCRLETPLKDHNKKLKVDKDKQHSTMSESIAEQITKDEEESIRALLELAGLFPENNNTNEINLKAETAEPESSTLPDSVEKCDLKMKCEPPTTSESKDLVRDLVDAKKDSKDVRDKNESRKRCSQHVFICRIIKQLQATEGKTVHSQKEPKHEKTNESVKKEATMANMTIFQEQRHGCGIEGRCSSAAAPEQVPFFGSLLYDPSQWPRPAFPEQQMWMNPFMTGGCYQNWQNGGKMLQQVPYKMKYGHRSSGYHENGGSFLVDSSPTLNLTLQ